MIEQAARAVSHESPQTGLGPLLAACDAMRRALLGPDVIRHSENITVELSYGAGRRFEDWFKWSAPPPVADALPHLINDDGATRSITIEGVRFAYPTCAAIDHPWLR